MTPKPEQSMPLALAENPIAAMLSKVIEGGITQDNVSALEKLCDLYERMQVKDAERAFNVAFTALQAKIPQIKATKSVPNNDGSVRYRFAPLEEIDAQLRPLALEHGFTYSFSETASDTENKVSKVCTIYHVGGHSRPNSFTVRRSAPPKSTDTQADGSTHSYAKRGALCDAFGIIIEHDDDARMVGKPIGKALGEEFQARVKACGANEEAFLRFAGAANYESIPDDRWDALDAMLKRKESGKAPVKSAETNGVECDHFHEAPACSDPKCWVLRQAEEFRL